MVQWLNWLGSARPPAGRQVALLQLVVVVVVVGGAECRAIEESSGREAPSPSQPQLGGAVEVSRVRLLF